MRKYLKILITTLILASPAVAFASTGGGGHGGGGGGGHGGGGGGGGHSGGGAGSHGGGMGGSHGGGFKTGGAAHAGYVHRGGPNGYRESHVRSASENFGVENMLYSSPFMICPPYDDENIGKNFNCARTTKARVR